MSWRRGVAITVGIAAFAGAVAVTPSSLQRIVVGGLLSGTGLSTSPISMTVTTDTTLSGTGSAGDPLAFDSAALQDFTYFLFGDASDGNCTWDGTTTVKGVAPGTSATTDGVQVPGTTKTYAIDSFMYCDNASVSSNVAVLARYPIFVAGTLTLDGWIHVNGHHSVANSTDGGRDGNGWMVGGTFSEGQQTSITGVADAMFSASSACSTFNNSGGLGNNGIDGNAPNHAGCGGGAGSQCNSNTAGTGRAPGVCGSCTSRLTISANNDTFFVGLGYANRPFGNAFVMATSTGGGGASNGGTIIGMGGGGAGQVAVFARKVTGSGKISATGGDGATPTPNPSTTACVGGGGGGGGGLVTLIVGGGATPTVDVSGGAGATGQSCTTGGCAGKHGGAGHDGAAGLSNVYNLGLP